MASSDFLTHAQLAALHRETYSSVLKGILSWGTAKHFAEQVVGITPVYLSNLRDPYHNPPSPQLAERIVSVLPLDSDQRHGLLEHMLLAREEHRQSEAVIADYMKQDFHEGHQALRRVYDSVLSTRVSEEYNRMLLGLRDVGKTTLQYLNPQHAGLVFIEICLMIYYAQSSLDRWEDAFFFIRLAEAILYSLDPSDDNIEVGWFHHLQVNLLCAKATAYRNLNLPKRALQSVNEALSLMESSAKAQRAIWLPVAYREKMEILTHLPRFTLAEVEGLADQILAVCDSYPGPLDALRLQVDRSLINAWVTYGGNRAFKRAGTRLRSRLDEPNILSQYGPLQSAMFLRTVARFYWYSGQFDEWRHFTRLLVTIARAGGLKHQMRQVSREFGSALDELNT